MKIIITSGPSYEPLDQVRRLTNFSTGELGTLLAESFAQAGHAVTHFRGIASTFPAPLWGVNVIPFTTNDDLEKSLMQFPGREEAQIVFHAAALCDFRVAEISSEQGGPLHRDKISSREGTLKVTLAPTPKLIASLRRLFPASILVGWKYELEGTLEDVRAKGRRQIDECLSDACVLNGRAYGSGFEIITRSGEQTRLPDKMTLCRHLVGWVEQIPLAVTTPGQESFHPLSSFVRQAPFM